METALAAHLRRSFGLVTWISGLFAQRYPGFVGSISFTQVLVLMVSWGIQVFYDCICFPLMVRLESMVVGSCCQSRTMS
ncbi:hypothetical protein BDV39DRAFT_184362 [Aspergillus sergii]|uniref:Uncharacterized protein n=1 Tax=Aspergillus sergii TaxID=1034303 RepID=A0A5N6WN60_9EURO|nr:hypothetical protein BDV39DRAFT_184362 [Aspergillus sergii]